MTVNHCWYSLVVWERVVRKERVRASYIVGDQCNAGSKSGSNASFPSCRAIRMEWGPRRELLPVNRVASGELSSAVSYLLIQWSKTMFGPTAARIEVMEKGRLGSEKFLVLRSLRTSPWSFRGTCGTLTWSWSPWIGWATTLFGFLSSILPNRKISGPWDIPMASKRHMFYSDLALVTLVNLILRFLMVHNPQLPNFKLMGHPHGLWEGHIVLWPGPGHLGEVMKHHHCLPHGQ